VIIVNLYLFLYLLLGEFFFYMIVTIIIMSSNRKGIAAAITQSRALSDGDHEEDSTESMMLTRSQYQQLLSLLHSKETSSAMALLSVRQPSSSSPNPQVNNSCVSGMATCFSTSTHSSHPTHISPWIIDTSATDI